MNSSLNISNVIHDEINNETSETMNSIGIQVNMINEITQDLGQAPISEQLTTTDGQTTSLPKKLKICLLAYGRKLRGMREPRAKRLPWYEYIWSFVGSIIGIAGIALIHFRLLEERHLSFLIGSFGASAVLVFGAPRSPFSQPRNLVGGHVLSATCGCIWRIILDRFERSIACALAVSTSIFIMQFTETTHPPGGATALLAVTTNPLLPWANFVFIFMPALSGSLILLAVALIVNNLSSYRTYPTLWW